MTDRQTDIRTDTQTDAQTDRRTMASYTALALRRSVKQCLLTRTAYAVFYMYSLGLCIMYVQAGPENWTVFESL